MLSLWHSSLVAWNLWYSTLCFTESYWKLRFVEVNLTSMICSGRLPLIASVIRKHSTAAVLEEPINPGVSVNYTQLLINGKFVDAASGQFPDLFDVVYQYFLALEIFFFPFGH